MRVHLAHALRVQCMCDADANGTRTDDEHVLGTAVDVQMR